VCFDGSMGCRDVGASLRSGGSRVARRSTTEASWPPRNPAVRGGIARAHRATIPHRPEGHRASWRRSRCLRGGELGWRSIRTVEIASEALSAGLSHYVLSACGTSIVRSEACGPYTRIIRPTTGTSSAFTFGTHCPHPAVPGARSQADRVAEVRLRRERGRGDRGPRARRRPSRRCPRRRGERPRASSPTGSGRVARPWRAGPQVFIVATAVRARVSPWRSQSMAMRHGVRQEFQE